MASILSDITQKELATHYAIITKPLKDAVDSPAVKSKIDQIGIDSGIDPQYLPQFEAVVSLVFLGILPPDFVGAELVESFAFEPKEAEHCAARLSAEIFAGYGDDLRLMFDPAKKVSLTEEAADLPAPQGSTLNLKIAPAAPLPSKTMPSVPPARMPVMSAAATPAPLPTTGPAKPAAAPAPFILKKTAAAAPSAQSSGFKLNLDPKIFGGGPSRPSAPPPAPKTAKIEIGNDLPPAPKATATVPGAPLAGTAAPRVVHYTALKSSFGVTPMPARPAGAPTETLKATQQAVPSAAPVPQKIAPAMPPKAMATPSYPQPVKITNAPGVPPAPMPTAPRPEQSPATTAAPAAPKASLPKVAPKVVNFTAEDSSR